MDGGDPGRVAIDVGLVLMAPTEAHRAGVAGKEGIVGEVEGQVAPALEGEDLLIQDEGACGRIHGIANAAAEPGLIQPADGVDGAQSRALRPS